MRSRMTHRLVSAALGASVLLLTGCGEGGNPFNPPPPDEFAVIKRRPLEMPQALGLPEPRPGTPSRLDIDPNREAEIALLGRPAPDTRATSVSQAEAALLQSADAASADSQIRVQLAQDEADEGPYTPPTVLELFGFEDPDALDETERLRPVEEAQRLQRAGVVAPSDPSALPPEPSDDPAATPLVRPIPAAVQPRPTEPITPRPRTPTPAPAVEPEQLPLELAPTASTRAAPRPAAPTPEPVIAARVPAATVTTSTAPAPQPVEPVLPPTRAVTTPEPVALSLAPAPEAVQVIAPAAPLPEPVTPAVEPEPALAPAPAPGIQAAPEPQRVAEEAEEAEEEAEIVLLPAVQPAPAGDVDSFYQKLGIVPPGGGQ